MPATLRVTREITLPPELQRGTFEISVDGTPVGSIENHSATETEIEPGEHHLVLRRGRYCSRTLSFSAGEGDVVEFECNGARIWPTWLASRFKPDMGIHLARR